MDTLLVLAPHLHNHRSAADDPGVTAARAAATAPSRPARRGRLSGRRRSRRGLDSLDDGAEDVTGVARCRSKQCVVRGTVRAVPGMQSVEFWV